jgi:hypothetical protein
LDAVSDRQQRRDSRFDHPGGPRSIIGILLVIALAAGVALLFVMRP